MRSEHCICKGLPFPVPRFGSYVCLDCGTHWHVALDTKGNPDWFDLAKV